MFDKYEKPGYIPILPSYKNKTILNHQKVSYEKKRIFILKIYKLYIPLQYN